MNLPAVTDPRTSALRRELGHLGGSLADLRDALQGVNDPAWLDAFQQTIAVGEEVIALHVDHVQRSVANDVTGLRSALQRHDIPREDSDLGPLESLRRLRAARGAALADTETVLRAAAEIGMQAAELGFEAPSTLAFERAGFEGMLRALGTRLSDVERSLRDLEPEAKPAEGVSVQQIGVINFFVSNMDVELALAKLEVTAKAIIDFAALGRSVEAIADLASDLLATVRAMPARFTETATRISSEIAGRTRRVTSGLRSIVHRVKKFVGPAGKTTQSDDVSEEFWQAIEQGDHTLRRGLLNEARAHYDAAEAIAQRAVSRDRKNSAWQRNLSVSFNKLGNVEVAAGNLAAARELFEAGLRIAERLATQAPGNAEWQRDLSVSLNKLGDIELEAGNLTAARAKFEADLDIAERLASQEPENAQWQRDLSVSLNRLGDVEIAAGNLAAARARFETATGIAERLAAQEPDNAEWWRNLSANFGRLGNVELAVGNLAAARARLEAGLGIGERLAAQAPDNAELQRDLSVSFNWLGEVELAAGNLAAARARFAAGLDIAERLAAQEPDNAQWQRDLFFSNAKLAQFAETSGDPAGAIARFEAAEAILKALVGAKPDHSGFARDLAYVHAALARLRAEP